MVVPGGAEAIGLWEALVDEQIGKPDRFGRALFSYDSGRLVQFFYSIVRLYEPHRRFALGTWMTDPGVRLDRFRQLYQAFASSMTIGFSRTHRSRVRLTTQQLY